MKTLIFTFIFVSGLTATVMAQTDDVTFLPGLGENATVWSGMSNELLQQYNYDERLADYNDEVSISAAADALFISSGAVVIAHSQGGLVAREYLRQSNPNHFKALITVGTPNTGAPIAANALNGNVTNVLLSWVNDLLFGPAVLLYEQLIPVPFDALLYLTQKKLLGEGADALQGYINNTYGSNPSVTDMIPGSNFLTTLNSNPDNTLPSARYAIYGAEGFPTPWHLLGSLYSGPGQVESLQGVKIYYDLLSTYANAVNTANRIARFYDRLADRAFYNGNFDKFWDYIEEKYSWYRIAAAFRVGYDSLLYWHQFSWSFYVTGTGATDFNPNTAPREDGILPVSTQAPDFFNTQDNINRRLVARTVNHIEETAHFNVRENISQIFQNYDVNVDDNLSLGVSISGMPYTNDGETLTFSANVSNAEGSVSYQWYYRQESWSSWIADGTNSSSYTHTFQSAPGGEDAHSAVKVEITSAGETAIDIHEVTVYGDCQSGGSNQVGTNAISPGCG